MLLAITLPALGLAIFGFSLVIGMFIFGLLRAAQDDHDGFGPSPEWEPPQPRPPIDVRDTPDHSQFDK